MLIILSVYVGVAFILTLAVSVAIRTGRGLPQWIPDERTFALAVAVVVAFWPGAVIYSILKKAVT